MAHNSQQFSTTRLMIGLLASTAFMTSMAQAADADISVGGFFVQSVNLVDADS